MISTNISKALTSDPSRPPRSRRVSKGSTADVAIPWHVAANAPTWPRGKHPNVKVHPKCLKVVRGPGVSKGWLAVANQVGIFWGLESLLMVLFSLFFWMACLIVMVVKKLRGSFFFFWLLWGKNATGLVFFGPFLTNNGQIWTNAFLQHFGGYACLLERSEE